MFIDIYFTLFYLFS